MVVMQAQLLVNLPSFVKVVELQSFSKAAAVLGMTKSAVSKQVQALEDVLKVRLLNRTTRTVRLTDEGELFYQQARQIVEAAMEAERSVKNLNERPSGMLHINAPESLGNYHLTPALIEFAKLYPDIVLEVQFTNKFINVLEEGVDVTIRVASLTDSSLIARKLSRCQFAFAASPEYLAKHGTPKHPDDLINHRFIEYSYIERPREIRYRASDGKSAVAVVTPALRANTNHLQRQATLEGLGVTVLPTFVIGEDIKSGKLTHIMKDFTLDPDRSIYALFPHNRHMSAKVRLFVDFIAARFGGTPYWEV
jgi:DNA-binding transcriptional LysR family regulator